MNKLKDTDIKKMKQHITSKQLNELSEKGKERLREWLIVNYRRDLPGHVVVDDTKVGISLLSIGQMIEYLDEEENNWDLGFAIGNSIGSDPYDGSSDFSKFKTGGLCNDLWRAVKKKLDK